MKLGKSISTFVLAALVASVPALALIPCTGACGCACCHKVREACCASLESRGNGTPSGCCDVEMNNQGNTISKEVPAVAAPGMGPCECASFPDIRVPLNTASQNVSAAPGAAMRPGGIAPVIPGTWPDGSPSRRSWNAEVPPHLFHCVFLC